MLNKNTIVVKKSFTLIELVIVIVILGILAAVALPKFVSMNSDAEKSVVEGFIGAIKSARTITFSKLVLCGSDYGKSGGLHLAHVIRIDGNEPQEVTCNANMMTGHGIGVRDLRDKILLDEAQEIFTDNPNQGDHIVFNTKTGRTININHDNATGAITWSASPAY